MNPVVCIQYPAAKLVLVTMEKSEYHWKMILACGRSCPWAHPLENIPMASHPSFFQCTVAQMWARVWKASAVCLLWHEAALRLSFEKPVLKSFAEGNNFVIPLCKINWFFSIPTITSYIEKSLKYHCTIFKKKNHKNLIILFALKEARERNNMGKV